ncbi:MAG: hypothetical protein WD049_04870 [Candidatus Paceibacterota bacterium]
MLEFIGLLIFIAGFVVGLGAVTVIDLHGFLARHSPYWTETTIRAHKVTKPLIWIGTTLAIIGGVFFYSQQVFTWIPMTHAIVAPILVLNGIFLSFYVSPYLLKQEREGRERELLPTRLQVAISASFVVSFVGWWGSLVLLAWYLTFHI